MTIVLRAFPCKLLGHKSIQGLGAFPSVCRYISASHSPAPNFFLVTSPPPLSTPTNLSRQQIRPASMSSATTFYDFKPVDKKGQAFPLADLKGKVVLVVNTASKCGFTPQFEGLEKLYKGMRSLSAPYQHDSLADTARSDVKAEHPDFEIIGFPCNQFGGQDPGSNDDIQSFCQVNYGVTFPVLGKTDVNGEKAEPVWEWMKDSKPGLLGLKRIKWNFEKFLISRDGKVKGRWASTTAPDKLKPAVCMPLRETRNYLLTNLHRLRKS